MDEEEDGGHPQIKDQRQSTRELVGTEENKQRVLKRHIRVWVYIQ